MKLVAMLCLLAAAGCSSGGGSNGPLPDLAMPPMPGWMLTGTLAGFSLQAEAISGEAHTKTTNGVVSTIVNLSSRAKICDLLQQSTTGCTGAGRILAFVIGGTEPGSYSIVTQTPGPGKARVLFVDLDSQCLQNASSSATSGSLTVTASNLSAGGLFSFSFDVTTADGPASGVATVSFCQI